MANTYYDTIVQLERVDSNELETAARVVYSDGVTEDQAARVARAYNRSQLELLKQQADRLGSGRRHAQTWFAFGGSGDPDYLPEIKYRASGPYPDGSYRVTKHVDGFPDPDPMPCLHCNGEEGSLTCVLCDATGYRFGWSARGRFVGGHWHVRMFVGSPGGTKANVGELIMSPADWENLKTQGELMEPPLAVTELHHINEAQ